MAEHHEWKGSHGPVKADHAVHLNVVSPSAGSSNQRDKPRRKPTRHEALLEKAQQHKMPRSSISRDWSANNAFPGTFPGPGRDTYPGCYGASGVDPLQAVRMQQEQQQQARLSSSGRPRSASKSRSSGASGSASSASSAAGAAASGSVPKRSRASPTHTRRRSSHHKPPSSFPAALSPHSQQPRRVHRAHSSAYMRRQKAFEYSASAPHALPHVTFTCESHSVSVQYNNGDEKSMDIARRVLNHLGFKHHPLEYQVPCTHVACQTTPKNSLRKSFPEGASVVVTVPYHPDAHSSSQDQSTEEDDAGSGGDESPRSFSPSYALEHELQERMDHHRRRLARMGRNAYYDDSFLALDNGVPAMFIDPLGSVNTIKRRPSSGNPHSRSSNSRSPSLAEEEMYVPRRRTASYDRYRMDAHAPPPRSTSFGDEDECYHHHLSPHVQYHDDHEAYAAGMANHPPSPQARFSDIPPLNLAPVKSFRTDGPDTSLSSPDVSLAKEVGVATTAFSQLSTRSTRSSASNTSQRSNTSHSSNSSTSSQYQEPWHAKFSSAI